MLMGARGDSGEFLAQRLADGNQSTAIGMGTGFDPDNFGGLAGEIEELLKVGLIEFADDVTDDEQSGWREIGGRKIDTDVGEGGTNFLGREADGEWGTVMKSDRL